MALEAWQATIQDEAGNTIPLAGVTVRVGGPTGALAVIYDDGIGLVEKANPFNATASGLAQFWAASGVYYIVGDLDGQTTDGWYVTLGGSGTIQYALTKMAEPIFGFDNGVTNTEVFASADRASQGLAYAEYGGNPTYFILQRVAGSSNLVDERQRICWVTVPSVTSPVALTGYTDPLALGHQCISAWMDGGDLKFVVQMPTVTGHEGNDAGKGIAVVDFNGAATVQGNVTSYQLFGFTGSGHRFERFYGASSAVSENGKWLVLVAHDRNAVVGDEEDAIEDAMNFAFIYDFAEVLAADDPLDVNPRWSFIVPPPDRGERTHYVQGVAIDDAHIYIQRGYVWARGLHYLQKFTLNGTKVDEFTLDDARAPYSVEDMMEDATLGIAVGFEPEGIALVDGNIHWLAMDDWREFGDVVTFEGQTFACIRDTTNRPETRTTPYPPTDERYWHLTTATAGGAWDDATEYLPGAYTRKAKTIWKIAPRTDAAGEYPLTAGKTAAISGASVASRANRVDMSIRAGDTWQLAAYSEASQTFYDLINFQGSKNLRLFDARPGSDNSVYGQIAMNTAGGSRIIEVRGPGGTMATAAGANFYAADDPNHPHKWRLTAGGEWVMEGLATVVNSLVPFNVNLPAISTSSTGPVSSQTAMSLTWVEGVRDLQIGEGLSFDWRVQLAGDAEPQVVARWDARKETSGDTGDSARRSSVHLMVSSTGAEADLQDVLSVDPATGIVNAPLGLTVAGVPAALVQATTTAARPTTGNAAGRMVFDTTLGKPIWRNAANSGWVDATGAAV